TIASTIEFPVEAKPEYSAEIDQLLAGHPACAVVVASPKIGANIIQAFKDRIAALPAAEQPSWQNFYWLGTTSLHSSAFLAESIVGNPPPAEGVWGADVDPAPERLSYTKLQNAYDAFYGKPLSEPLPPLAANAWDALAVLSLAIAAG